MFFSSTLDSFLGLFGTLGRSLLELCQPQNLAWWAGRCSAPGFSRKRGHILLEIDDGDDEDEGDEVDEDENVDDEGRA